ncbi:hypothetical protein [Streptomyces sp. NPDC048309]|uniref:hypothetical protein n=1 Tax=Streptomyces sp. NPDC048309 TaxID=3154618 RepID=UPI0033C30BD8
MSAAVMLKVHAPVELGSGRVQAPQWGAFAWLVQGQAPPQRRDGHLHTLVVAEIALGLEFLVQIFALCCPSS